MPQRRHRPRLVDLVPGFAADLERELYRRGDGELAGQVPELRVFSYCGCGDYRCASFTTRESANRDPERQVETVPVDELDGMVNLDVIDGIICYVEVLHRPDLRSALEAEFGRDTLPELSS